MKFRAFALGAGIAAAATGLLPVTAMAATVHLAGTPTTTTGAGASIGVGPGTGTGTGTSAGTGAGAGASSAASANNKNNINVEVVTQLPRDIYWHDKTLYDHGKRLPLPAGYSYADGGVVGTNDQFYFAPAGAHEGVIVAPMRCQGGVYGDKPVKASNWIGDIVDSALKACAGVYKAAYDIIAKVGGTGDLYGGSC